MTEHGEARDRPVVLAADDDEDILELVAFRLERAGYEVIAVEDGERALEAARERRPSLAVLDVMMPKLTGYEVVRALREEPLAPSFLAPEVGPADDEHEDEQQVPREEQEADELDRAHG